MNWGRGLFRLWAVISIVWIGGAFVLIDPISNAENPITAYQNKAQITEARAAGYTDAEITAYLRRHVAIDFSEVAFIPPAMLLALGLAGAWVNRGFRARRSN